MDDVRVRINFGWLRRLVGSRRALPVVAAICVALVGLLTLVISNASTNDAEVKVGTADGCWLAGRVWNAKKGECATDCRGSSPADKLQYTNGTPRRAYCAQNIATNVTEGNCTQSYHRYWVVEIGCARRADQDNTNGARQCLPDYPNYVADGSVDRCVADTIAKESATTTDNITARKCQLYGRVVNTAGNCEHVCTSNPPTGTLLHNAKADIFYCNRAVADISQAACDASHRLWLTVGCARRADQTNAQNAIQCQDGYPNYNANPANSDVDTCVKPASGSNPGSSSSNPGNNNSGTNSGSQNNAKSSTTVTSYKNPIVGENAPDPDVVYDPGSGTYYLYATGRGNNGHPFLFWHTKDLKVWVKGNSANIFTSTPGDLKSGDIAWAPDVEKTGDHYTMTYTGGTSARREIGYATSANPGGPFTYRGVLVAPGALGSPDALGTIDSHIFMDGNQAYLSVGGGVIRVIKLAIHSNGTISRSGNGNQVATGKTVSGQWTTAEGSFLTKHGDWYYLYYSFGDYTLKSGAREYRTMVARSKSPMGPFTGNHDILTGAGNDFRGPGGQSIFTDVAGQDWMVYHAWHDGKRVAMLDAITYKDGWPVVHGGHPSSVKQTGLTIKQ